MLKGKRKKEKGKRKKEKGKRKKEKGKRKKEKACLYQKTSLNFLNSKFLILIPKHDIIYPSMNFGLFPAFFEKPVNIRFEQQEPDELIELFLRRHWVTNVPWIIIALFLSILPFAAVIVDVMLQLGLTTNLPFQISTGLIIIWYMFVTAYVIENFLFWYFNIYIVTNKHIVDVNYSSLLARSVVEVKIEDVQSQKASIKGIIRQLFNFGDVVIETAAENQRIDFIDIPKPDLVADRVQDIKSSIIEKGRP